MIDLNYEWLGFAQTTEDAARIVKDTGVFYFTISIAYFGAFLYMLWQSPMTLKIKKTHSLGVIMWAFYGGCLIFHPTIFSIFINFFVLLVSLIVLFQLHYTSPLLGEAKVTSSKIKSDNKKLMYAKTLLTKMGHSLSDILKFSIINEQILWLLIGYRAAIALRASFAL